MSFEKEIPSNVEVVNILGINDKNLKYIKSVFPNVMINVRGNTIFIEGQDKDAKEIMRIFDEMVMMNNNGQNIEETDVALLTNIKDTQKHGGKKISAISIIKIVFPLTFIMTFGKTDLIYLRFLSLMPKILTTSTFEGISFSKLIKLPST